MTALIVICIILCVVASLLFLKASIVIKCNESVELYVRVLFFKIGILPKKSGVDYRDYSLKKLKKKQSKDSKKAKAKADKKSKKQAAKQGGKKNKADLASNITFIIELVKILLKKFFGHLKIEVTRIVVTVSTDDPAKTGVVYGAVCAGVSQLLELLDRITTVRRRGKHEVNVRADFLPGKISYDIELRFSLRVIGALDIALSLAYNYIKDKLKKQKSKPPVKAEKDTQENGGETNG